MKNNTLKKLSRIAKPFSYGKGDHHKINELEKLLSNPLPENFKKFLLEWGGYKMVASEQGDFSFIINFNNRKGGRDFVDIIQSSTIQSILRMCEDWGRILPINSVCFEETGDGSNIFLSMLPGSEGEIYYMERDHMVHFPEFDDYEYEEDACKAFNPAKGIVPNIFTKIGNDFNEFIQNIEMVEDDDDE